MNNYLEYFSSDPVALATLFLAIATFITLFFIGFQYKLSRQEYNADYRPWIFRESEFETRRRLKDDSKEIDEFYNLINYPNSDYYPDVKRVKVPFVNMGKIASSSITYYHRFYNIDMIKNLIDDINIDNGLTDLKLEHRERFKSDLKDKNKSYRAIGNRTIIPKALFIKKFYLATKKMEIYLKNNPIDEENLLSQYQQGQTLYLAILIEYYQKGRNKPYEYGGILELKAEKRHFRDDWWRYEWAT